MIKMMSHIFLQVHSTAVTYSELDGLAFNHHSRANKVRIYPLHTFSFFSSIVTVALLPSPLCKRFFDPSSLLNILHTLRIHVSPFLSLLENSL